MTTIKATNLVIGETYTRHTTCPALCEAEKLFTRPAPPPANHIGDATKLAGERAALIAQLSNDDADMLRRKWFGHRNTGHLSFVEAVDATMEGLMAQQVAVPMTEQELDDLLPTNDSMSRKDSQRWIARAVERHHKIGVKP